MNRQIVLSPLTLALAVGLVLAALVIAVLATVMLAVGGEASIPVQTDASSASPTTSSAATAVASSLVRPAEVTATEEVPPAPTPAPTEPIAPTPTPTPLAIVVQATAVQPTTVITPAPTPKMLACVARVTEPNYRTGGPVGSVTVMNEPTGTVTTFRDGGYGQWLAGMCAARQGTCTARVIGFVSVDGTTTVVSETTGEVSSFV